MSLLSSTTATTITESATATATATTTTTGTPTAATTTTTDTPTTTNSHSSSSTTSTGSIRKSVSTSCLLTPKYSTGITFVSSSSSSNKSHTSNSNKTQLLKVTDRLLSFRRSKNTGTSLDKLNNSSDHSSSSSNSNSSSNDNDDHDSNESSNSTSSKCHVIDSNEQLSSVRRVVSQPTLSSLSSLSSSPSSSSVTIIHREKLPSYTSDRYYLLSEIELVGRPIIFLLNNNNNNANSTTNNDTDTQETDDLSFVNDDDNDNDNDNDNNLVQQQQQQLKNNTSTSTTTIVSQPISVSSPTITPTMTGTTTTSTTVLPTVFVPPVSTTVLQQQSSSSSSTDIDIDFPPYVLLYLLWDGTNIKMNNGTLFANTIIRTAIEQLQQYVTIIDSRSTTATTSTCTTTTSTTPTFLSNNNNNDNTTIFTSKSKPLVNLYLLIERINPSSSASTGSIDHMIAHDPIIPEEIELVESLTRYIASPIVSSSCSGDDVNTTTTKSWRHMIQGITVGVSNGTRAVPALDAAVQAISYGSADRRRYSVMKKQSNNVSSNQYHQQLDSSDDENDCTTNDNNNNMSSQSNTNNNNTTKNNTILYDRSRIGIVTMTTDDVVGIDVHTVDDVAMTNNNNHHHHHNSTTNTIPICQSKVVAEWNGNGNIQSFAHRAHTEWKSIVLHLESCNSSISSSNTTTTGSNNQQQHQRQIQIQIPIETTTAIITLSNVTGCICPSSSFLSYDNKIIHHQQPMILSSKRPKVRRLIKPITTSTGNTNTNSTSNTNILSSLSTSTTNSLRLIGGSYVSKKHYYSSSRRHSTNTNNFTIDATSNYDSLDSSSCHDDIVDFVVFCCLFGYIMYHFYDDVLAFMLSIVFGV